MAVACHQQHRRQHAALQRSSACQNPRPQLRQAWEREGEGEGEGEGQWEGGVALKTLEQGEEKALEGESAGILW